MGDGEVILPPPPPKKKKQWRSVGHLPGVSEDSVSVTSVVSISVAT